MFVVDSGASYHLVSKNYLHKKEIKTIRRSLTPVHLSTANGEVIAEYTALLYVKELGVCVEAYILDDVPPVLSLGKLCDEEGFEFEWKNKKATLSHPDKKIFGTPIKIVSKIMSKVPMVYPAADADNNIDTQPDAKVAAITNARA